MISQWLHFGHLLTRYSVQGKNFFQNTGVGFFPSHSWAFYKAGDASQIVTATGPSPLNKLNVSCGGIMFRAHFEVR